MKKAHDWNRGLILSIHYKYPNFKTMQNTENSANSQEQGAEKNAPTTQEESRKEAAKAKRAALIALSNTLKPLVESGQFESLNKAIIDTYQNSQDEPVSFKTIQSWNKDGYSVNKGSKAFLIWGKPKTIEARDGEEERDFFPVAYLFASNQVTKRQPSNR